MNASAVRRFVRAALGLALASAAPAALAQNFTVTLSPPSAPPLANAATLNVPSSVFFDVTNALAGTTINQIDFTLPKFWPTGGAGPVGWTVASVSEHANDTTVSFAVAACGQGGLANGSKGTFRLDFTPATNSGLAADATFAFNAIAPSDPCGGPTGWTPLRPNIIPVKVLYLTASASPSAGSSPLATTVTFDVTNQATATLTVLAPTPTANPGTGTTSTPCVPASLNLASGASSAFTCGYTFSSAPASYTVAATVASSPAGSSAVGAVVGPILIGPATATFAFDKLGAASGDVVRATLSVTNQTGSPMTITPPTYAQLSLTNLSRAAGTSDPVAAAGVPAGATRSFVYALGVTGAPGASYVASGTAAVTGGTSNLAVTPAGTVSSFKATWLPAARRSGAAAPYQFTVTVTNRSSTAIGEVDVVNPQNGAWTGLANVNATGMTYSTKTTVGATDTLRYTGALAQNGTATIAFGFTAIPTATTTTAYPFQVRVFGSSGGGGTTALPIGTFDASVAITVPLPDVANVSLLSTSAGQTLYWTNTSSANGTHDGVVVFRAAAPGAPATPVDGADYTGSPSAVYFDRYASPISTIGDPAIGAWNYRVCNHDANLVYSNCNSGFWNNAGWLDSEAAPSGGWTHTSGYQVLLYPGIVPGGRVGFASNAPALNVLTAATGARPFDPVPLAAVPALGTPIATLGNGRQILFAADQAGAVTALDVQAGASYWQVTKPGESFTAGVGGALRQYAVAAFQARYANDVLFLGSTTGRLLALDATTGATLWTANAGTAIRALPLYDYARNWLYVPTDGAGILAYDLGSAATPPSAAAGWVNPGGAYRLGCTRADTAAQMTCVDNAGGIKVFDRSTGATVATGTSPGTPSSAWKVAGGLVVGSSSAVRTFTLSGASFTLDGTYAPAGKTLSEVQVFQSAGFIYVGASDLQLHKLRLADATEVLPAVAVTSQQAGTLLGPAVFDVSSNLFIFGASDGRVWAVPYF